jgi:hypothetical protein
MPHEFWREVVDRVATEVPGTLLLAEAFWLLEGYFVRTLGMHRVYNSAFMNMLRDEENAKYRSYLKKTIEFDPDIMRRYVNFMSNPDERTAIDQFGTGDKYFGICTLLATLPGLPMFGHGQIEGYTERYGMEFKQARMEEWPDEGLVARHQSEIAPLLKKRYIFAGSAHFILYDFWTGYGTVNENVFAYSNRAEGERSLVVYNNKYDSTQGTVHVSAAAMDKGSGALRQWNLADGLELSYDSSVIMSYRDVRRGLEYLRRARDFRSYGLNLDLQGFQCVVLLNWRELRPSAEWPWDRLCDALNGAGVPNLDEEIAKLRLRPLHEAMREVVRAETIEGVGAASAVLFARLVESLPEVRAVRTKRAEVTAASHVSEARHGAPGLVVIEREYVEGVEAMVSAAELMPALVKTVAEEWSVDAARTLPKAEPGIETQWTWGPVLAWIALKNVPWEGDRVELFDRLRMRDGLAEIFGAMGMEGEARWQAAARVRVLLGQSDGEPGTVRKELWADGDVRWLTGVHESGGFTYFNKERFEELLGWLQVPALMEIAQEETGGAGALREVEGGVMAACERAREAGYQLQRYLKAGRGELLAAGS